MQVTRQDVLTFRSVLADGAVVNTYRALLSYMQGLRTHFEREHPDFSISDLYVGRLDVTFFAVAPPSLKRHDLKVLILFDYGSFRFEVWLAARNRTLQRQHWERMRSHTWPSCKVVSPAPGVDAILECDVADGEGLVDRDALTDAIRSSVSALIGDVEAFLGERDAGL